MGERAHAGFLARRERLILDFLCACLPRWIVPDHMTAFGIIGAFVTFCGFIGSRFAPAFFWLAVLGLVLHWLGDSLDGSLARYRRCERVKYGYFLDSTTDAFCALVIMTGLGFSAYVRMEAALFALAGYYMLCMNVFLNHHLSGVHRLSFLGFGPTEMRLGLIALSIWMFFAGRLGVTIAGSFVSVYDFAVFASGVISVAVFVREMMGRIEQLRDQEATQFTEAPTQPAEI